jgi:transposase
MDGVVEIITGRERRRRWGIEEKLRILAETTEPGVVVCQGLTGHGADRPSEIADRQAGSNHSA